MSPLAVVWVLTIITQAAPTAPVLEWAYSSQATCQEHLAAALAGEFKGARMATCSRLEVDKVNGGKG